MACAPFVLEPQIQRALNHPKKLQERTALPNAPRVWTSLDTRFAVPQTARRARLAAAGRWAEQSFPYPLRPSCANSRCLISLVRACDESVADRSTAWSMEN